MSAKNTVFKMGSIQRRICLAHRWVLCCFYSCNGSDKKKKADKDNEEVGMFCVLMVK